MNVLAFDCAVSGLGVAVMRDGACLADVTQEGRDQAAQLLPAIATALVQAGIDRRALSLIAVTVGPGSFTGVRVGLAAARGLSLGLGVPLAGLSTTAVLVAQAPSGGGRLVVAAIDSRLGDWFCAIGEGGAPFVASADEVALRLAGCACLVVGTGIQALVEQLVAAGIDATAEETVPDPVSLGRLASQVGVETWRAQNRREGLPRPLYLRGVNITLPDGARRTVD
ncbi:tRNA (adenosine(37)-N6)-threonylcarbamoyltransferase complex dimerization subunit type 1 TsaB [soil metagenome]